VGISPAALARYYGVDAVRQRVLDYAGGQSSCSLTARSLAAYGGYSHLHQPDDWGPIALAPLLLDSAFEDGDDICRSLADSGGTLLLLDVDYANPQDPSEPYSDPRSVFLHLDEVRTAILDAFRDHHVRPLVLMTARGWHFVARVPRGTPLHDGLVALGALSPSLVARVLQVESVEAEEALLDARAHVGAGKLLEHLAHRLLRTLRGGIGVPIDLADVPPSGRGGFICLDLSAYADPLFLRYSRCAFSSNQKARVSRLAPDRPFVIVLPHGLVDTAGLLSIREDLAAAAAFAEDADVRIPDVPDEAVSWLADYRRGPLVGLHREMDDAWTEPAIEPVVESLPACAAMPLRWPDPSLLEPAYIRTVTCALGARGWRPGGVAALIRSRYGREPRLRRLFERYDAGSRAAFYVRLFWGTSAAGLETREGFSCASQKGRGTCVGEACGHDLALLFDRFRKREGGFS